MKRVLTVLLVVCSYVAFGQGQDLIINTAGLDGFVYGNKSGGIDSLIVPDTDSLGQYKIQNVKNPINPLDAVNLRTLLSAGSAGVDSIPFNPENGNQEMYFSGAIVYTTNFDSRYVRIQDSTDVYVNWNTLLDSINRVDSTIEEIATSTKYVYTVYLPINGTLAGSVSAAIEGVDYPTGWVLSASSNDLQINHGLDRYTADITVAYNYSGTGYRQLRNFADAYSGKFDVDTNNTTIESVAYPFYTQYRIKISILFE